MANADPTTKASRHKLVPAEFWPGATPPPRLRDVLNQIGDFLQSVGFHDTFTSLIEEAESQSIEVKLSEFRADFTTESPGRRLMDDWYTIEVVDGYRPELPDTEDEIESESENEEAGSEKDDVEGGAPLDQEAAKSSADSSDSEEDSSSDDSRPSAKAGQKRKRQFTPESSDDSSSDSESEPDVMKDNEGAPNKSDSESESSSDESDERPLKRTKVNSPKASVSGSSSDSDSDGSSSGPDSVKGSGKSKKSSSSSSGSESSSHADSASEDSGSNSDSSSQSSSDSKSSPSPPPPSKKQKKVKKDKPKVFNSIQVNKAHRSPSPASSSATLEAVSPVKSDPKEAKKIDTLVVHDDTEGVRHLPATKENVRKLKKEQVGFSRIPADTKVDPKFSSNAYVPYDYADRAYRDLSITKGKGFTKEKNKKKKGESSSQKPAEQRQWEIQARRHLSLQSSPPAHGDLFDDDNAFAFKHDTWDFMSGCGFDPIGGCWRL